MNQNVVQQQESIWNNRSLFETISIRDFVMVRPPDELMENRSSIISSDIRIDLQRLRKELIDDFFEPATSQTDIMIKRKLGILTNDVCDYYRFQKKPNEFALVPTVQYDNDLNSTDLLNGFQHACVTCPLDFVSVNNTSSAFESHVYMCDVCHCTRTLLDNMTRHLETELHTSASEYLADSTNMVLQYCVRRQCIQNSVRNESTIDSIILCPICCEPFSSVTSCAIHSHLLHNVDYIYSIAHVCQTFDLRIKRDHDCMHCGEQYKKLAQLTKHLDETGHGPRETDTHMPFFLCPATGCRYRTKRFFNFKTHLMLMHSNLFHPNTSSIRVKVKQLIKPRSYMHMARFLHKTQIEIDDELRALNELENDMKHLVDNDNMLKLIRIRRDILKHLNENKLTIS